MEETIDLQELFQILKKRLALIIVLAIVATLISGVFTNFFMTPIYQASTQLIVSRSEMDHAATNAEISGNITLINSFNDILVSPRILEQVITDLNLGETPSSLRNRMTARNATNSLVITLTVRHESPTTARDIADKTAEIFTHDLPTLMNFDNVNVLATAQIPSSPVSPRFTMNLGVGFLIGVMSGIFLAFLMEFMDKTVKTEQEVERLIGVPVLGLVPLMTAEDLIKKSR